MAPLSVQLYSLREASAEDFDGVLSAVAEMSYDGVEPFNLFDFSPRAFKARVEELGMRISSSHYPWANRAPINEVVDVLGELGLSRAIGGFGPDDFKDQDALQRTIETTAALQEGLARHDIRLALHNHYWEYALLDGRLAYHALQDALPTLEFEIDTYWAANFGACDPAREVARVAARTPLLHIKDGPLVQGEAMVAVGDGAMNISEVIAAAAPDTLEWLVVELDACDTDMLKAIARSRTNLAKLLEAA